VDSTVRVVFRSKPISRADMLTSETVKTRRPRSSPPLQANHSSPALEKLSGDGAENHLGFYEIDAEGARKDSDAGAP
jgi:hypothetical protein